MEATLLWGTDLILTLQQYRFLEPLMQFFTLLGDEYFFLAFVPFFYWSVDVALGVRLAIMLLSVTGIVDFFKLALRQPRPYWIDPRVLALNSHGSYGLPSAHAANAVGIWGQLARATHRRWAWALLVVIALLISLSRIYLGVHFPFQTVAGWLIGVVVLVLVARFERPFVAWWRGLGLARQLLLAAAVGGAYLAVGATAAAVNGGTPDPAAWIANAVAGDPEEPVLGPGNLEDIVTDSASLFGLGAGLALMNRYARYDAGGPWSQRLARYALGVAVTFAIWGVLRAVFPQGAEPVALALRFVRYGLLLLWVAFAGPWVFLRLGLAAPAGK